MTPERVLMEREGSVAILSFSNPPDGYMDDRTSEELAQALDAVEGDAKIRAVLLTGKDPGVFIRHFDVRILEERGRKLAARGIRFSVDRPVPEPTLHLCQRRIEASSKPFVCALNGTAMGGGFELALACDIRVAQDGPFSLGLPEVNIGLLPGAGGTQRLTRLLGVGAAMSFMLLGRVVSPRDAAAMGLVHSCVPDARAEGLVLAEALAAKSAQAVAHIKRLVHAAGQGTPAERLADERTLFCELMVSDEAIALMSAMNRGERDIREP